MTDLSLYKDLYERELDLRHKLRRALALPVGVLALLGGVITFLVRNHEFRNTAVSVVFVAMLIVASIFFICSVYYLIRCLNGGLRNSGYWYMRLPQPSEIRDYQMSLRDYYGNDEKGRDNAQDKFRDFLLDRLCEATDRNRYNNLSKSEYLYQAKRSVILSLVFVALSGVPFLVALICQT